MGLITLKWAYIITLKSNNMEMKKSLNKNQFQLKPTKKKSPKKAQKRKSPRKPIFNR
jgi:hypothetical protein